MKDGRIVLRFGFLLWLIPFAIAFLIFPIREGNRPLFESIMPVVLTLSVVVLTRIYLMRSDSGYARAGATAGGLWLLVGGMGWLLDAKAPRAVPGEPFATAGAAE